MTDDPIRRAWAAWREHERRTAVQLEIPELHLTDEDEADTLSEQEQSDRRENDHV